MSSRTQYRTQPCNRPPLYRIDKNLSYKPVTAKRNVRPRSWTQAEEDCLLDSRQKKVPYKHIAVHLKKSELACRLHYHQMIARNRSEEDNNMDEIFVDHDSSSSTTSTASPPLSPPPSLFGSSPHSLPTLPGLESLFQMNHHRRAISLPSHPCHIKTLVGRHARKLSSDLAQDLLVCGAFNDPLQKESLHHPEPGQGCCYREHLTYNSIGCRCSGRMKMSAENTFIPPDVTLTVNSPTSSSLSPPLWNTTPDIGRLGPAWICEASLQLPPIENKYLLSNTERCSVSSLLNTMS